jgi:hypothetical protein
MNSGMDIEAAFLEAREHHETKQMHFHNSVSLSITTKACTDLSAPGLCDRVVAKSSSSRAETPPTANRQLSLHDAPRTAAAKTKAKKLRKKAKQAEEKAARAAAEKAAADANRKRRAPAALENGGVGDRRQKGTGKGKRHDKTTAAYSKGEGLSICFNWGKGKPCSAGDACPHEHCCQICMSTDHKTKDHK